MSETQKTAQTKKKKNQPKPKSRVYGVIVLSISFALACLVSITSLTPKRYDVSVGSPATEAITTPRMVEDSVNTEALRQAARDGVDPVYAVDEKLADTLVSNAQSFFSALASFRNAAQTMRASTAPAVGDGDADNTDTRTWQEAVPTNDLMAMLVKLPVPVSDTSLGYSLLEATDAEIDQLKEGKQERLKSIETRQQALAEAMAGGFKEEVPKNFGVSYAQGDSTFLVRFFDSGMFAGDGGLSPRGVQALQVWARHVGSVLGRQARESGVGSKPGAPIEVQVRGHCSTAKASGDPGWDLSLRRAHEAVRVLEGSLKRVDFPLCLLSITGMADYRPAY